MDRKKRRKMRSRTKAVATGLSLQLPLLAIASGTAFALPAGPHLSSSAPAAPSFASAIASRYPAVHTPPTVAVVLARAKSLGEAQADQARAITEQFLTSAQVERISQSEFDVVISPISGFSEARVVQAAQKADFFHVTIEDPSKLAHATLIPGVQSLDLQAPQTSPVETPGGLVGTTPTVVGTPRTYTVKAGDCLWTISGAVFGDPLKWPELAAINHLSNPNLIEPGQVLQIG